MSGWLGLRGHDWIGLVVALGSPAVAALLRYAAVAAAEWRPSPLTHGFANASPFVATAIATAGAAAGMFIATGPFAIRSVAAVFAGLTGFAIYWILAVFAGAG